MQPVKTADMYIGDIMKKESKTTNERYSISPTSSSDYVAKGREFDEGELNFYSS